VYKVVFTKEAARALQKIPRDTIDSIREKLEHLAEDPFARNPNVTKLQNRPGFRLRVGDWRVIYEVQKEQVVIIVIKIAPRGEVYR
jgi:mRNA interferase RelE/StbE